MCVIPGLSQLYQLGGISYASFNLGWSNLVKLVSLNTNILLTISTKVRCAKPIFHLAESKCGRLWKIPFEINNKMIIDN